MSKLRQLQQMETYGLPVPPFRSLTWNDWQSGKAEQFITGLRFPLAVRSTFSEEDGEQQSLAGHFSTVLEVGADQLADAIQTVFDSYPQPEGQEVIIQEMIDAEYSGVLFAFRRGVWWLEWTEGLGEQVVSGQVQPHQLLLPRFSRLDHRLSNVFAFWQPSSVPTPLRRALIELSAYSGQLLGQLDAVYGLDIEFAVARGQLYFLQSRPITTPAEEQVLLTSANHKEILPPQPSRLMSSVIAASGDQLFAYYRQLDPSLPTRSFIHLSAGMPWINLSALYDTMVHWGLPTKLVAESVGAQDVYTVGFRPWRMIRKLPIFLKVLGQQWFAHGNTRRWLATQTQHIDQHQKERNHNWPDNAAAATKGWLSDLQNTYVGLVHQMQVMTGAMSGPLSLLERLGWTAELAAYRSTSTDYYFAFRDFLHGRLTPAAFLEAYGHRGFYESDLSQPRFAEYTDEQWKQLRGETPPPPAESQPTKPAWWKRPLLRYTANLIHRREWFRHESMRLFFALRQELQTHYPSPEPWQQTARQLVQTAGGTDPGDAWGPPALPEPQGWDQDTFLCNRLDRRLPIRAIFGDTDAPQPSIGIYPGKVVGQVWRVHQAGLEALQVPDFPSIILVADALDPGWIPFFQRVQGVAAYTGGLLSHASIILREARVPAVTQLASDEDWQTGDWVVLDGQKGTLERRAMT